MQLGPWVSVVQNAVLMIPVFDVYWQYSSQERNETALLELNNSLIFARCKQLNFFDLKRVLRPKMESTSPSKATS